MDRKKANYVADRVLWRYGDLNAEQSLDFSVRGFLQSEMPDEYKLLEEARGDERIEDYLISIVAKKRGEELGRIVSREAATRKLFYGNGGVVETMQKMCFTERQRRKNGG